MATALLAFAGVGCVEPLEPVERDPNARDLIIRLSVPGQGIPVTKAGTGPVNGISPESQVYTVQVWAFNHHAADSDDGDSEKAVAYSTVDLGTTGWANTVQRPSGYYDKWTNTTTYEVPMTFPGYVLDRATEDLKFDFYVLANASSIGCTAGQDTPRGTLKSLSFGGNFFGTGNSTTTPPTSPTTSVPATGLPISGFFNKTKDTDSSAESPYVGPANGVDLRFLKTQPNITAAEMHKLVPVVQLQRAVSKIRFAFARPTGMTDIQITKIVIGEKLIPASTFVFPREDGTEFELPNGSGYTTGAATIGSDDSPLFVVPKNYTGSDIIAAVSDPEALKSDSEKKLTTDQAETPSQMDAQEYDTFLSAHSTSQIAYLRESGKPITGTIYYRLPGMGAGDKDLEVTFNMPDPVTSETNFHRNHYWTVYAYFLQDGNLYVKPVVADWIDATGNPLTYTLKMNTNMRLFDSWLYRYDTDGDYTDYTKWATSHMAVSDGRVTETSEVEPVAGRPLRSPQIQLVTTGVNDPNVANSGTFELRIDNTDFEILRVNKNATTGAVASYAASTNGVLTIAAGEDVYTYFYIVPKDGVTPSNPVAKVSLIYNDPVIGPQKVTFNSNTLPGYSDDSSEIWAYYVNPGDYKYIIDIVEGQEKPRYLKMYYQDYNYPLVPTPVQN